METKVSKYIKENWKTTIRDNSFADERVMVRFERPYTVPCAETLFVNFYYWDTYFTNIGLLLDGLSVQAENNIVNMRNFIKRWGYIPNSDLCINRSQPPLFTRAVYDYYVFTGDKKIILENIEYIMKELKFFQMDRMTPCGLNAYKNMATNAYLEDFFEEINRDRLNLNKDRKFGEIKVASNLLSIAESGWDFNCRFATEENRFATDEFAHLDLNCLLYDAERKTSEMLAIIGEKEKSAEYAKKANDRKSLMYKYMRDEKTGIFYDYNFVTNSFSKTLSCASLYVFDMGISDDKKAAKAILKELELEHGLSVCPYRGEVEYYQWDYPAMWPTNVFFAVNGLKKIGLNEEGDRISEKYTGVVEAVFANTGKLWEKYDAKNGNVSVTQEYTTPAMMGWTAGVYEYLTQKHKYMLKF